MSTEKAKPPTRRLDLNAWAMAGVLALMWALLAVLPATRGVFLTQGNIATLLVQSAVLLVVSVGMTMVILVRGIDLSVGAGVALTGVVAALIQIKLGLSAPIAIAAALGAGALIGVWHGVWVAWLGMVDDARAEQAALTRLRDLSIKAPGLDAEVATLSGGNQQKVVIGKWLELEPRVLLLDEPTRGVDVGAKAEIYRLVEELTARGHAVLLASSDLPEVVRLADRVLVLREGRLAGTLERPEITQLAIMQLAVGAKS